MSNGETTKQILRIFGVFTPLVVFWGIYYQQNSTWIIQGTQMNCYIGSLHVPPGKHLWQSNHNQCLSAKTSCPV